MQAESIFDYIIVKIKKEFSDANDSISANMTIYFDNNLFDELIKKANDGCMVSLIVSSKTINQIITKKLEQINIDKFKIYSIGRNNDEFLDDMYFIIDGDKLLTVNFYKRKKSKSSLDDIILVFDDVVLTLFESDFINSINKYHSEIKTPNSDGIFPLKEIVNRLEIIKDYLIINNIDEVNKITKTIKKYEFNFDLQQINQNIKDGNYEKAIITIQNFLNKYDQLALWSKSEIISLKLELKFLEDKLSSLIYIRVESEKTLSGFHHRHTIEFGEIILEILRLKKLKFKDDKELLEEAQQDEIEYKVQVEIEKEKKVYEVSEDQKAKIKNLYIMAVVLCTPDKFSNEPIEIQKMAEEIFIELNEANEKNDIKRIEEILLNLENGILSLSIGNKIDDKEKLKANIMRLKEKILTIEDQIIGIKESDTFKFINEITDWDEYFRDTKERLEKELGKLNQSIG